MTIVAGTENEEDEVVGIDEPKHRSTGVLPTTSRSVVYPVLSSVDFLSEVENSEKNNRSSGKGSSRVRTRRTKYSTCPPTFSTDIDHTSRR